MSFEYEQIGVKENRSSTNNTTSVKFTPDQEKAFNNIINFINTEFTTANYMMGLAGAGGVGKTFLIKYIITSPSCHLATGAIKCTSTTHKAARVFSQALDGIKVNTIQSVLGLRLDLKLEDFNPNNPQFAPGGKQKLDNVKLLIIDEASMLPSKFVGYLSKVAKERGIKILFVGDTSQLSPVNENKSTAFAICPEVNKLTQIVRQGNNNPTLFLLDMLRKDIVNHTTYFIDYITKHHGEMNYNDNEEGYSIVGPQGFKNFVDICFDEKQYRNDIWLYKVICYTNNKIAIWNKYIRDRIISDSSKGIIRKDDLCLSYETIVDQFGGIIINNSEEYIIHDIIDTVDNNGIKGIDVRFQLVYGGNITRPIFIVDHTNLPSIIKWVDMADNLKQRAISSTSANRVARWKEYYEFKKTHLIATNIIDRNDGSLKYNRDIDYAYALTAHKSQGSTYDTVLMDMNDMVWDKNGRPYTNRDDLLRRLYVAASRASKNLIIGYGNIG